MIGQINARRAEAAFRDYDPKAAKILIAWRVSASILRRNAIWDPSGDQTGFVSSWGADVMSG